MADRYDELNTKIENLTNLVSKLLESAKLNQVDLLNLPKKNLLADPNINGQNIMTEETTGKANNNSISGKAYADVVAEGQATVNYNSTNNYFIIVK